MSDLGAMARAADERAAIATAAYDALKSTGKLRSHLLLTYRCGRRCVLLEVLQFPQGRVFAQPRYKLSPALNVTSSSESGRAKNTEDGDRRWQRRVFFEQDALNVELNCDHVRRSILTKDTVAEHIADGRAEVVIDR